MCLILIWLEHQTLRQKVPLASQFFQGSVSIPDVSRLFAVSHVAYGDKNPSCCLSSCCKSMFASTGGGTCSELFERGARLGKHGSLCATFSVTFSRNGFADFDAGLYVRKCVSPLFWGGSF